LNSVKAFDCCQSMITTRLKKIKSMLFASFFKTIRPIYNN